MFAQIIATAAQAAPVAQGAAQGKPQGSPFMSFVPMILVFVVLIFFMNRSQKKQQQQRQNMIDQITKGAKVLLTSGIYGTVEEVQDEAFIVEIADQVRIKVNKNGIATVETENEAAQTGK